jgi:hypothetical protein
MNSFSYNNFNAEVYYHDLFHTFPEYTNALSLLHSDPNPANTAHISERFGILNVYPTSPITAGTQVHWDILFSMDHSGSMDDICKDGKSKLQHALHTLKNILILFAKTTDRGKFHVYLQIFDDSVTKVFGFTPIYHGNIDSILRKIDEIHSSNCTNLLYPLESAQDVFMERQLQFPTHKQCHIMLTDGEDTFGNTIKNILPTLKSLADINTRNIFIGYGDTHNSLLLEAMSNSSDKNVYRFIDKYESAGLVYGEIIHDIMYMTTDTFTIEATNGLFYDWKINEWTPCISLGGLSCNRNYTVHFKVCDPTNPIELQFGYILLDTPERNDYENAMVPSPEIAKYIANNMIRSLDKYIFRQYVLELMYKVKNLNKLDEEEGEGKNDDDDDYPEHVEESQTDEEIFIRALNLNLDALPRISTDVSDKYKLKLKTAFKIMKRYMIEHGYEKDVFWKVLLDDIYIAYKTINSAYSHLFTSARQMSQGRQYSYTVNNLDIIDEEFFQEEEQYENKNENENESSIPLSPRLPIFTRNHTNLIPPSTPRRPLFRATNQRNYSDYYNYNLHENNSDRETDRERDIQEESEDEDMQYVVSDSLLSPYANKIITDIMSQIQ